MFYNYVLHNVKDGTLYVGYTSDLKKRLKEHNRKSTKFTSTRGPWKLIYYESCLNQKDALRREKYLKTTQGKRLLKRRLKEYLSARRYSK